MSLNYYFKPQHTASSTRLLQFYDALINLIDEDYLPYLDRHEKMTLPYNSRPDTTVERCRLSASTWARPSIGCARQSNQA